MAAFRWQHFPYAAITCLTLINLGCGGGLKPSKEPISSTEKTSGGDAGGNGCQTNAATGLKLSVDNPTWYGDIKPFFDAKCTYCHGGKAGDPGPTLVTFAQVSSKASESLSNMKKTDEPMPPANATPQLAATDVTMLTNWINSGKPEGTPPVTIDPTKPVYYNDHMKTLLAQYCTGCHKPGEQSPDLSTYEAAKAAGALSLADVKNKTMPKAAPLSANDIAVFQKWTDLGYPLDATTPVPAPAPAPGPVDPKNGAFYNDNIKNLLAADCVMCHKAGAQAPDLSTYELAKTGAAASLAAVERGSMPPAGAWSAEKIALLKEWIDAGSPEGAPTGTGDSTAPTQCP